MKVSHLYTLVGRIEVLELKHDVSLGDRESLAAQVLLLYNGLAAELGRMQEEAKAEAAAWDRKTRQEHNKRRGIQQASLFPEGKS